MTVEKLLTKTDQTVWYGVRIPPVEAYADCSSFEKMVFLPRDAMHGAVLVIVTLSVCHTRGCVHMVRPTDQQINAHRRSQEFVLEGAFSLWALLTPDWLLYVSLLSRVLGRKYINLAHFLLKMYFWTSWGRATAPLPLPGYAYVNAATLHAYRS